MIGEEVVIFVFIKVRDMFLIFFFSDTAFTPVTAYKLAAAGEAVDGKPAIVGTAVTVGHSGVCNFRLLSRGSMVVSRSSA
ncbi:MAG: hypothetical protein V8Q57_01225 [Blautia sp.]